MWNIVTLSGPVNTYVNMLTNAMTKYLSIRWVAILAAMRRFGTFFHLSFMRHPTVFHLAVHLENRRVFQSRESGGQSGTATVDNINKFLRVLSSRCFCSHLAVCWNATLLHLECSIKIINFSVAFTMFSQIIMNVLSSIVASECSWFDVVSTTEIR